MSILSYLNPLRYKPITWLNFVWRLFQFVVGLVIIGMYAQDLNAARKADKYADGKWVLAVVVGALGAFAALVQIVAAGKIRYHLVAILFAIEWILVILYATITGIFWNMYSGEHVEMESGIARMKTAAGFDAAGLILWFCSACVATWYFLGRNKGDGMALDHELKNAEKTRRSRRK